MIYLDHAASTPPSKRALVAFHTTATDHFGNPSSIHSLGRDANKVLRQSRTRIADLLRVPSDTIIFTSGGTESDNLAIIGYALAHQHLGKHVITTSIEHHAVLRAFSYLEKEAGFRVSYLEPQNGTISAQQVAEALEDDTILVSVMYANNETGLLLPIADIGKTLSQHPTAFHVDAVQAMGKMPIYPEEMGIDLLSASSHKFHGVKGAGFLYSKSNKLHPLLFGGDQEDKKRAGTENLPAIASMAAALAESLETATADWEHAKQLEKHILTQLDSAGIAYHIHAKTQKLPYILNLSLADQPNDQLLMQLDLAGFAISTGSACTAGVPEPSHVLTSLYGKDSPHLSQSIRISFSKATTLEEVSAFADALITIYR